MTGLAGSGSTALGTFAPPGAMMSTLAPSRLDSLNPSTDDVDGVGGAGGRRAARGSNGRRRAGGEAAGAECQRGARHQRARLKCRGRRSKLFLRRPVPWSGRWGQLVARRQEVPSVVPTVHNNASMNNSSNCGNTDHLILIVL